MAPAFEPVPTVTVAKMDDIGQAGLEPWMGADFVCPGLAGGSDQMAEQTVWVAWAPLALARVRAKRAAPERARSLTKKMRSFRILHKSSRDVHLSPWLSGKEAWACSWPR